MPTPAPIKRTEYVRRRRQLMREAGEESILILPAAAQRLRNGDTHFPYRQDSDFLYLTGFPEPEAVLVLVPGRAHGEAILFCRERDPQREAWDGPRLGPEAAAEALGVDDAYPIADLDEILPGLIEGRPHVYYHFGRDTEFDLKLIGWVNQARAALSQGRQSPHEFLELGHLLHEQRLFKSRDELRLMRHAAGIAAEAHRAAMRAARPGLTEYQIEAELLYVMRRGNAVPAYQPIVGSGANACILHYVDSAGPLAAGELLLIDAGAEYAGYASDITRTFPVDGVFTREQRALYDLVLAAQTAALEQARPGRTWLDPHRAAVEALTEGMLRLGLLKGSLKQCLKDASYRRFYPHKTGHWLGLDTHDVGDYQLGDAFRLFEPGMVFTVEPGLYIPPGSKGVPARWQGVGIRIEDDVAISADGHEVLTDAVPKQPEAIEALMAEARRQAA